MQIHFAAKADEQLRRLPRHLQKRIVSKLELYALQPDPLQFAEPLSGIRAYRFRVGDYRIIFDVIGDVLWILAIKRRDEAYR